MINSEQALKSQIKKIAVEKGITFNETLQNYIFDRFIARLSESNFREKFVIKGGFYLSAIIGIENRTTLDIDTEIINANFTKKNIKNMTSEIIKIDLNDHISFRIKDIKEIMEGADYTGYRITIDYSLFEMKNSFHLDVATGDAIFSGPVDYEYKTIIDNESYSVYVYPIETFLSEKIESILSKSEYSSRMKDFYDVYIICKMRFSTIDISNFKESLNKVFENRNFAMDEYECLANIRKSNVLKDYWKGYSNTNPYAQNVSFEDTVKCLEQLINLYKS